MSSIHTFDMIVSNEAFRAFTSDRLPFEGDAEQAFRSSFDDLLEQREAVRAEVRRLSVNIPMFHPLGHYGPKWYRRLTDAPFAQPFPVPDSPDEIMPFRTALNWYRMLCQPRTVRRRSTRSTEMVLSGTSRPDAARRARLWEDFFRNGCVRPSSRAFEVASDGTVVVLHNDSFDRRGAKRPTKNRSESWCPDLRGFAWDYPVQGEFGYSDPVQPVLGSDGFSEGIRDTSPWYVTSDTDYTEIRRRARVLTFWRDMRRSYKIAENVWEDVAQDAVIRFARILQDVWDWEVLERDDQGRPVAWRYDRFRAEDVALSESSDPADPAADPADPAEVPADETDNGDEAPTRYFRVTRVTFYRWSVNAALIRYNLGKPDNQDDDGHWAQGVTPRPEQVMSANTWTSHVNLHSQDVWDEVWANGAEYPVLRRTLAAQAKRPKATNVQITAEVADLTFNPPKVTQKWRLATKGAAQDELHRLGANLDKRRRETRSVFIRDEASDGGIN